MSFMQMRAALPPAAAPSAPSPGSRPRWRTTAAAPATAAAAARAGAASATAGWAEFPRTAARASSVAAAILDGGVQGSAAQSSASGASWQSARSPRSPGLSPHAPLVYGEASSLRLASAAQSATAAVRAASAAAAARARGGVQASAEALSEQTALLSFGERVEHKARKAAAEARQRAVKRQEEELRRAADEAAAAEAARAAAAAERTAATAALRAALSAALAAAEGMDVEGARPALDGCEAAQRSWDDFETDATLLCSGGSGGAGGVAALRERVRRAQTELSQSLAPAAAALESARAGVAALGSVLSPPAGVAWDAPATLEALGAEHGARAREAARAARRNAADASALAAAAAQLAGAREGFAALCTALEAVLPPGGPRPGPPGDATLALRPLTAAEEAEVAEALSDNGDAAEVLAELKNVPVRRSDMGTLAAKQWLNDEVINYFVELLRERAKQQAGGCRVYLHNTMFYAKLAESKVQGSNEVRPPTHATCRGGGASG